MKKSAFLEIPRALATALALIAAVTVSSAQARDARDYHEDPQAEDGYTEPDDDPTPGAYQREEPDDAPRPHPQGAFAGRRAPPERYDDDPDGPPPGVAPRGFRPPPVERQDLPPPVTRLAPIPAAPPPPPPPLDAGPPRPHWRSEPGWGAGTYRESPPRPPHLRVYAPPAQKDRPHNVHTPVTARNPRAPHDVPAASARTVAKASPDLPKKEAREPVQTSVTKPPPAPVSAPEAPVMNRQRAAQTRENASGSANARGPEADIVNKAAPKLNLEKQ